MSQQPFSIPLRTSSANALNPEMLPSKPSQDKLKDHRTSKAQKILGTSEVAVQQTNKDREEKRRTRRPTFMRSPETKPKKSSGFVTFPVASANPTVPPQNLRVRASSPLLGQEYRARDTAVPPLPEPKRKIHQSGSALALYSHFNFRDSSSEQGTGSESGRKSSGRGSSRGRDAKPDPSLDFGLKQPKGPAKESKRKIRPPRIDLSLLFPKPRAEAAPLLSPQRMVESPSPVSIASGMAPAPPKTPDNHVAAKTQTKSAPTQTPPVKPRSRQSANTVRGPSTIFEKNNDNWFDPSLEKTVRTIEMDMALQNPDPARNSRFFQRPRSREELEASVLPADNLRKVSSNSSIGGWSKETHLSPRDCSRVHANGLANSTRPRQISASSAPHSSTSEKSRSSTFKDADLTMSSVLCLSSSEDEDEEEDHVLPKDRGIPRRPRDSVAMYSDFGAELGTAAAAQATKGVLRRAEPTGSVGSHRSGSQRSASTQRQPSFRRAPSTRGVPAPSSKSQSRRSSLVPTIMEPEPPHGEPLSNGAQSSAKRTLSQKELNRRSRVMAVTRQEEDLLAAIRERRGKITPSIFPGGRSDADTPEPDRGSVYSAAPSRESFYGSETSFLRLSGAFPLNTVLADQGATQHDKGALSNSLGVESDTEQKTTPVSASPRTSLVYTESLPSPATSSASPLTPTLPIHRFSPLPSQKPHPRHPPPAIPTVQRQHSRRRTDSSEAIVLGESGESRDRHDFPIWALGWSNDDGGHGSHLTTVH
ncbi:hypothetical protein BDW42DRAFT_30322 [Aspergillus taichungensis]|uniref:Uncharacterized protein n=1 Tax=Aspergillus taichungensis TaxID=482145 RepID=A0A2J5I4A8_9EURO|nr:hypothetical protein BDW42DRAFT_30322 [Aspergillus taichungensis]